MAVNRYIITGGPGSGKSTLLKALAEEGLPCFLEVSRGIIREQQIAGGDLFPWGDLEGFAEECFQRMQHQIMQSSKLEVAIFDRGIPDIAAYLKCAGLPISSKFTKGLQPYNTTVFICPPWEEIFINDPQRPETFEHSVSLYRQLVKEYRRQGARLVELPKISVERRVELVEREIDLVSLINSNLLHENYLK